MPKSPIVDLRYNGAMPPPALIPPPRSYPPSDIVTPGTQQPPVNIAPKSNRKSFGFKPIARAQPTSTPSSSLRKFFPGDDDDSEQQQPLEPPPPSPVVSQREGYQVLPNQTSGKAAWPPLEQHEVQSPTPSWAPSEQVIPPHAEPTYNGQHVGKQPPKLQPSEPVWSDDLSRHVYTPPSSTLNDKPRKPPSHKLAAKPAVPFLPPSQSSPASQFTLVTPSPLSAPPPSSSSSIISISSIDEPSGPARSKKANAPVPSNKPFYNILTQVGEGTFGKVYKARNSVSGLLVALKRIRMETEKDGFPVTAMREIKLLQSLRHENVVQLYEMIVSKGTFSDHLSHSRMLTHNRFCLHGL